MKLRHNRPAWIVHCCAAQSAQDERRQNDDGMSRGIIPFGAVHQWQSMEHQRLTAALAAPVPARITGWDESGVGLLLTCPYCQRQHRHIFLPDQWQSDQPLQAACGKGAYRIALPPPHHKQNIKQGIK